MAYQAKTAVSHRGVQPGRIPERGRLHVPLEVLGPVSDVIELLSQNITHIPPLVDLAGDEEEA